MRIPGFCGVLDFSAATTGDLGLRLGFFVILIDYLPLLAMAYEEAQRRIAAAKAEGAQELDLAGLELEELPPEIGQLTGLQQLDLRGNQLSNLPPQIGQLTSLKLLFLGNNQLDRKSVV